MKKNTTATTATTATAKNSNRTATATVTTTTATETAKTVLKNSDAVSHEAKRVLLEKARSARAQAMYDYAKQQMLEKKVEHFYFDTDNTSTFYKDDAQVVQFDFAHCSRKVSDRIQIHYRSTDVHIYVGDNTKVDTKCIDKFQVHYDLNKHERKFRMTDDEARVFVDTIIKQYATATATTAKKQTTAKKNSTKKATA